LFHQREIKRIDLIMYFAPLVNFNIFMKFNYLKCNKGILKADFVELLNRYKIYLDNILNVKIRGVEKVVTSSSLI